MKKKIKILICYHKKYSLLKDDILTPIHVGRALAQKRMDHESDEYKWLMSNLIGDDTGDNISEKNDTYNEMTSLYWAWKNYGKLGNPDYIGMMHYRRHFILREGDIDVVHFDGMDEHYFEEINYSPENMQKLVGDCDFVAHIGKVNNVYNHYLENHRQEDLDLAFDILNEKYPEYSAVVEEYFAGDYSNFCNMFIFSRQLFFQYCEWIFDILNEFGERVDISEKRLFVSERLTGVFLAKQMKNTTLKYKIIPISFIDEPAIVPIVMPLSEENQFPLAVTILSMLMNGLPQTQYDFEFICQQGITKALKNKFSYFEKNYTNCSCSFLDTDIEQEYYPLIIPELLPKVKKCIYLDENSIILKDLSEFYRTCSVDDFYVVGAPQEQYDIHEHNKRLNTSLLVMNCESMRKHNIYKKAESLIKKGTDGNDLFNSLLAGQIGYIPWHFLTVVGNTAPKELFDHRKTRGNYQADAVWKPLVFYNEETPWEFPQGVFSNFWWDFAEKIPVSFRFVNTSLWVLEKQINLEQQEINCISFPRLSSEFQTEDPAEYVNVKSAEEWRTYSFWGKLKFYYDHNGIKKTIKYGFYKLFGGK